MQATNLVPHPMLDTTGIYVLKYLTPSGAKSALLKPTTEDLQNGVILAETEEGSGIMQCRLLSGKPLLLKFEQIVDVFPFARREADGMVQSS